MHENTTPIPLNAEVELESYQVFMTDFTREH